MKTLHYSILFGIGITSVIILGLILAFTLPLTGTTLQSNGLSQNSNYSNDMQNAVDVNSAIRRTITPEKICFQADDNFFAQYPTILKAIPQSDSFVLYNETVQVGPLVRYYNGEGVDLSKDQIITLLSKYDFNHTTTYSTDHKHTFKFRNEYFTCGFQYGNNNYDLLLQYDKLMGTENNLGYVPIIIADNATGHSKDVVYGTFNNTLVFNNTLGIPVTLVVTSDANLPDRQVTIPSHELYFLYLNKNVPSPSDVTYHYQIDNFPQIQGNVTVKQAPNCMNQEMTQSLYLQNGFSIKFPTYLPDGFIPVCNESDVENIAIEEFTNSTGIAQYGDHHFYHISANQHEDNGIIVAMAIMHYGENATGLAYRDYKNDISIAYDNSTFYRYGDGSIMTYVASGSISTVVFTTGDQSYTFAGKVPLEELVKMVKSLA